MDPPRLCIHEKKNMVYEAQIATTACARNASPTSRSGEIGTRTLSSTHASAAGNAARGRGKIGVLRATDQRRDKALVTEKFVKTGIYDDHGSA
jgi:hypothetical protein